MVRRIFWPRPALGPVLRAAGACTLALALAAVAAVLLSAPAVSAAQGRWVGTWATGPVAVEPPPPEVQAEEVPTPAPRTPVRVRNQTIRQVVRTSIGGSQVRVAVTNLFGTEPLEVGAAHVAPRAGGETIGGGAHLTFGGHPSVTIEAGSTVLSDAVALAVAPLSDLVVDLHLPGDTWGSTSPATMHMTGLSTTYVSAPGNHVGAEQFDDDRDTQQWFYLSRVDVWTESASGAIVAMGDSITDGTGSTVDANRRWPDFLARRLAAEHGDAAPGVLNVGIAGNRVLSHNAGLGILRRAGGAAPPDTGAPPNPNALFGPSGLSRFDRDVLLQPGATHVIVLETTNDIGMAFDDPWPSVDDLIAGHRTLIQRAHARGLTVYGGTLLPFEGAFYWTEAGEAKRQTLNAWIRTSGAYDGVIDFDAAVRDPDQPTRFRWDLHAGDWLHPSDAGYEAMANAIDLSLFDAAATARAAAVAGPRTPWGAPDLGGVWDFRTLTPLERPEALADKAVLNPEEAAAFRTTALESRNADRRDGGASRDVERAYNDFWWDYGDSLTADLRTSLIVDPPDGRIPPRVDGVDDADQARRVARRRPVRERVVIGSPAHGPEDLGLSERCMLGFNAGPPMLPSAYNNNIQILQTPDHVVIFNEMVHDARIVPLGDVPHLPGDVRQWLGDSRGRWEGDSLVVESTNFTSKTGSFYTIARSYGSGETARLVERFTREDGDRLRYEFTVDDPATFSQPFTAMIPMTRTDAPLFEYACHEGNYGMTNLLAGARVQERAQTPRDVEDGRAADRGVGDDRARNRRSRGGTLRTGAVYATGRSDSSRISGAATGAADWHFRATEGAIRCGHSPIAGT